jgi:hypothetical protein
MESLPNDSVAMVGTMPGSRPMNPMKLPLTLGSWTSVSLVMLPPISFDVTSTSGDSAVTVRVSSIPPTSIVTSMLAVRPTSSWRSRRLNFLKPCRAAVTSYRPGTRAVAMKAPLSPDDVSRTIPVSWLRTVTVTPGIADPCASTTRPRTSDVPCCAAAMPTISSQAHIQP